MRGSDGNYCCYGRTCFQNSSRRLCSRGKRGRRHPPHSATIGGCSLQRHVSVSRTREPRFLSHAKQIMEWLGCRLAGNAVQCTSRGCIYRRVASLRWFSQTWIPTHTITDAPSVHKTERSRYRSTTRSMPVVAVFVCETALQCR